jgi:hypothetical protein
VTEKLYAVGSKEKDLLLRCYDDKDNQEVELTASSATGTNMFTSLVELEPQQGEPALTPQELAKRARNLVCSTDDGKLLVYGHEAKKHVRAGRECDAYQTHCGAINVMKKSFDNKILVTAGEDGTIFVFRVTEGPNNKIGKWADKIQERMESLRRLQEAKNEDGRLKNAKKGA